MFKQMLAKRCKCVLVRRHAVCSSDCLLEDVSDYLLGGVKCVQVTAC